MTGDVAVVGLGLIGGSLARDLAGCGVRVSAYDTDRAALATAVEEGVVARVLDADLDGIERHDAVVIATPVDVAGDILRAAAHRLRRVPLVTDVCSTKMSVVTAARESGLRERFVGGHPLAGDHRSGWTASRPGLFRGAPVYLCPAEPEATARAQVLWTMVGGVTEFIEPGEHDDLLAHTSHLPQVVSTALMRTLLSAGVDAAQLGPGGRDMTRIAHSPAALWTGIALDNADRLGDAVLGLVSELVQLRYALDRRDADGLRRFFELRPDVPGAWSATLADEGAPVVPGA